MIRVGVRFSRYRASIPKGYRRAAHRPCHPSAPRVRPSSALEGTGWPRAARWAAGTPYGGTAARAASDMGLRISEHFPIAPSTRCNVSFWPTKPPQETTNILRRSEGPHRLLLRLHGWQKRAEAASSLWLPRRRALRPERRPPHRRYCLASYMTGEPAGRCAAHSWTRRMTPPVRAICHALWGRRCTPGTWH